MANVSISPKLTDSHCVRMAKMLGEHWQAELTKMHSNGDFVIGHGKNGRCEEVHSAPYDGNFWIWTDKQGCKVFVSQRKGEPRDYAGAGRVPAGTYRGTGHCVCGQGH